MVTHSDAARRAGERSQTRDWNAVYSELLPRVYRYFCYRVGEGQLAEDLTATTLEKAWRYRRRYRRDLSAFSTWVFTIARRVAIDDFRTQKETLPLKTALIADDAAPSPEAEAANRDDFERLEVLLREFSARDREVLALKYGAGLSQREIADLTGLTQSNVGVIIHRSVTRLRGIWEATDE